MDRRESFGVIIAGMCGLPDVDFLKEHKNLSDIEKIACRYLCDVNNYILGEECDDEFLLSIENKIGIPEPSVDDFRRSIMAHIGSLHFKEMPITWDFNPQLAAGFKSKLDEEFEN